MLNYKNTQKEHYQVLIATPGKNMASEYLKSLLSTIKILNSNNISWIYTNEYSPIITNAREATLCGTTNLDITNPHPGLGKFTYDKIFCIDSDIAWHPDHFLRLLGSDKDVISGVYYNSFGTHAMVHLSKESHAPMSREDITSKKDLFSVYGVGLGFICIKKGVFESLERPWFRMGVSTIEIDGKNYNLPVGEDLYFCERISERGYDVFVDPSVSVGHVKSNVIG